MSQGIGDAATAVATFVQYYGPKMQRTCSEWVRQNLPLKPCKNWAMSVICGFGTIEANMLSQMPVQDATAPPSVKIGSYRVAPQTLSFKARRAKRRSRGGRGGGDDDGPDWDEGGFGGSGGGGWDGNNSGGGGGDGDFWGARWNEEGWWWEEAGDTAFNLIYQVACWISLSQCLQFVLKRGLHVFHNGMDDSSRDAGGFAQCSSVFVCRNFEGVVDDDMAKLR